MHSSNTYHDYDFVWPSRKSRLFQKGQSTQAKFWSRPIDDSLFGGTSDPMGTTSLCVCCFCDLDLPLSAAILVPPTFELHASSFLVLAGKRWRIPSV
jgi:hypothetical protein